MINDTRQQLLGFSNCIANKYKACTLPERVDPSLRSDHLTWHRSAPSAKKKRKTLLFYNIDADSQGKQKNTRGSIKR